MAAAGVAMRTLQEFMGHRDFKTTLIYADYAPGTNEVDLVNAAFAPTRNSRSNRSNSDQPALDHPESDAADSGHERPEAR